MSPRLTNTMSTSCQFRSMSKWGHFTFLHMVIAWAVLEPRWQRHSKQFRCNCVNEPLVWHVQRFRRPRARPTPARPPGDGDEIVVKIAPALPVLSRCFFFSFP